jgi:general secretion pathway protein D
MTLLMVSLALCQQAQPPEPPAAEPTITLDVRGLDIDNLLRFLSQTFNMTIVKDPAVTGPVTILCPKPVTKREALNLLNAVLEARGFTSLLSGQALKIVPLSKAVQSRVDIHTGAGASSVPDTSQIITHIVTLKQLDAAQLQQQLQPLVTTGASIVSDTVSNSLIITDYAPNVARLLEVIQQLDSQDASQVRVFGLQYADATQMASLLTSTFFSQQRQGQTSGFGGPLPGQGRLMGGPFGAFQAALRAGTQARVSTGQAVADTRTNSVVVTTSPERMTAIENVIKQLDRSMPYASTVTMLPLRRANAADVAQILNQAFGVTGTRTTGTTTRQTQGIQTSRLGTSGLGGLGSSSGLGQRTRLQAPAALAEQKQEAAGANEEQQMQSAPESGSSERRVMGQVPTTRVSGVATVAPATAARPIAGQVSTVLEAAGNVSVVAEPNTNTLIVNAPPEYFEMLQNLVQQLDQPAPQVLIEAIVAEVSLDATRKLGVEWSWTLGNHFGTSGETGTLSTGLGAAATGGELAGFRYAVSGDKVTSLLRALATDQKVSILSTPRIFTSNNRQAVINISTTTPYTSSVQVSEIAGQIFSIQFVDVGIILTVTPQISADGTVTMDVVQEANDILGYEEFGGGNVTARAPRIARRSAEATVTVADGQSVILGGIIRDNSTKTVNKVPLLGDIPLLGTLFRSASTTKQKTELMVFLTPRVVRTPQDAHALTESQRSEMKSPPALPAAPAKQESELAPAPG